MKIQIPASLLLVLAAMMMLVSCQRAASQSPVGSLATPTGTTASAAEQTANMSQIQMIGTTQMIQTMTAMFKETQAVSTPAGPEVTPNALTLVPPTGVATTPPALGTPIIIVPTSTPGRPTTYTLMPGEYAYCIARRFNVNQTELLTLNGFTSAELLQPGMVVRIPQTGNPFVGERALHPHPGTYTVSSSEDTIYRVACYFGDVDPTQIIAANSLISPYVLHLNQALNIP